MSSRYYEDLWREGVSELVSHLDAEHPEDWATAPKNLADWAGLYIAYLQTLRKLCTAHDGVAHAQKRRCLRATLEACMGRVLELRAYLIQMNEGVDVLDLGDQLAAFSLAPDVLELPVPSYFREGRAAQLGARAQALTAAAGAIAAQGGISSGGVGGAEVAGAAAATAVEADRPRAAEAEGDEARHGGEGVAGGGESLTPAVQPEGVQGVAEAGDELSSQQEQQQGEQQQQAEQQQQQQQAEQEVAQQAGADEEQHQQDEAEHKRREAAAVVVQAVARGWFTRRRVARERVEELQFLGMVPPARCQRSEAVQQRVAAIVAQRKAQQAERQRELDEGMLGIKASLRQQEGLGMKEQIRDKLNDWFLRSRNPETGEYPDLPVAAKGGGRDIVHPPPPQPTPEEAAAAAKAAAAAAAKASRAPTGRGRQPDAAPKVSQEFTEGLRDAVQQYMDVWHQYEPKDPTLALLPPELQGLPQPRGGSGAECFDADMVTAEVRPVVFEEIRLEAEDDMRRLIQNIKDMLKAGRAARTKKGAKGKESAAGKDAKKKGGAVAASKKAGSAATKGGKQSAPAAKGDTAAVEVPVKTRKKDLTAGRSIESIFAELATAGLVRLPPAVRVTDFLGGDKVAPTVNTPRPAQAAKPRAGGKKSNALAPTPVNREPAGKAAGGKGRGGAGGGGDGDGAPYHELSLAQARQAVVASCLLPLGAHPALSRLKGPKAVLLYGPAGSGKTLLSMAAAHEAGATLFDLSPAAIAGKFPGAKQAALMVHMVFKAARSLAPSIVLVEDVDHIFLTDRARAALVTPPGGEPPNRIKKALMAEVADLECGDGVLVLCTSRQPQACVKRDERLLRTLVQRYIQLPLPDYGNRHTLLQAFAKREGLVLGESASTLAHMTAGLSGGQLVELVRQMAAHLRLNTGTDTIGSAASNMATTTAANAVAAPTTSAAVCGDVVEEPGSGSPGQSASTSAGVQEKGEGQALLCPSAAAISAAVVQLLPGFVPQSVAEAQELREWMLQVHQPLPPEEEPKDGKKKKK